MSLTVFHGKKKILLPVLAMLVLLGIFASGRLLPPAPWSPEELTLIESLWLENLPPPPPSPDNAVADDPRAAALGHRLFFDPRLSIDKQTSCADCHQPTRYFTDGLEKGQALGQSARNTMSIVGSAWSPWQYWDGRRDSLWSQALSPIEDPNEQGSNRLHVLHMLAADAGLRADYEQIFGDLPDLADEGRFPAHASPLAEQEDWRQAWAGMKEADRQRVNQAFANIGKALAAYERRLRPGITRFDEYVHSLVESGPAAADALLSRDERAGLRLFIGEARCMECHNGPLLSNNEFHNTGVLSFPGELPDRGRIEGVKQVLENPFNCQGPYSDAGPGQCPELEYVRTGIELLGAFRTPGLRNLAQTAPYMHKGQLKSLEAVLEHYNRAADSMIGHNEAKPLDLSGRELGQLEAFLQTLNAPPGNAEKWLSAPE